MKRFIATLLAALILLSFSGCTFTIKPENTEKPTENDIDLLRPDYGFWECQELSGNVTVILLYVDDKVSSWTVAEADKYTEEEVRPALDFLEKCADDYGIVLNLEVKEQRTGIYYENDLETDTKQSGYATIDVLNTAAWALGYASDDECHTAYQRLYGNEEVVFITAFNRQGVAYGLNPRRGQEQVCTEHCIAFAFDEETAKDPLPGQQASVIARIILYLYGAESLASEPERKAIAIKYYDSDIMMRCAFNINENYIGHATAFYIGWTDKPPKCMYEENW